MRHPRIRTKLLVGVLAGAVLASGIQFLILYRATMGNLDRLETERMGENLGVALNVVSGQKLALEQLARHYGSPLAAEHVVTRDEAWLRENVLGRLTGVGSVPLVAVLDADGKPIVATDQVDAVVLGDSVVRSATGGVAETEYAVIDGDIWMLAAAPMAIDEGDNDFVGTVLIGRPVDDDFAKLIQRSTQTEIAFTLEDKVVASTKEELTPVIVNALGGSFTHKGAEVVSAEGYSAVTELLGVPGAQGNLVVASSREPITTAQRALLRDSFIAALFALGVGVIIALVISRQLGRPITELTTVAKQIAAAATVETKVTVQTPVAKPAKKGRGKPAAAAEPTLEMPAQAAGDDRGFHEARVPVSAQRRDEVSDLGRAFNDMAEQVELAHETLRRMAVRDGLTGLLNHREFFERLRAEIAAADRDQSPLSMLMIDLDLFKKINDTHGHLAGDALLTELSRMIEANVREYDVVARYAGDEFAVILPRTGSEQAAAIGERVRVGTDGLPQAAGLPEDEKVTISVGIVTRRPKQRRPDRDESQVRREAELEARRTVEQADTALYRAKNGGRDRVEIQEPAG
jgi:diguanylate cyclase (GGDEF)-like protein